MTRIRTLLLLIVIGCLGQHAATACTLTGTASINLGSRTSFDARTADLMAGSGNSGLNCASILGLLSSQYIYATLDSVTPLTHTASGDQINFSVSATAGGTPMTTGVTSGNLSSASLLSFGGNGDVSLFVQLSAASNISAGTYTGAINMRWHYATCSNISALNICIGGWTRTAGITQNGCPLGLCTLQTGSLPGTGSAVSITVTLVISADCRFDASDVNFGSAPFVSSFDPIAGELRITCTRNATYDVGLSNGGAHNGRRRMSNGTNYLEYDIFRPGNTVWNATTQRVQQSTPAHGINAQLFPYEARIYLDQGTPPPGLYSDTLIIDVRF